MKIIDGKLLEQYMTNPLSQSVDEEIRSKFSIPTNRYYSVTVFPPERAGEVRVDLIRTREVSAKKISKSNQ